MTSDPSAPYKTVTKHLQRVEGGDEALLTCQSEGLPKSSVQWLDGHGRPLNASTTATVTPQQLIRVTSWIQVRFHDDSNYTCSFDGGVSATFVLRGESSETGAVGESAKLARWRRKRQGRFPLRSRQISGKTRPRAFTVWRRKHPSQEDLVISRVAQMWLLAAAR